MKTYQVLYYFLDGKLDCSKPYIMLVRADTMIDAMNMAHNSCEQRILVDKCIEVKH